MLKLAGLVDIIQTEAIPHSTGKVIGVRNSLVLATLPSGSLGELCLIHSRGRSLPAQIVSFGGDNVSLAPLVALDGLTAGATVESLGQGPFIPLDDALPGRVLGALGLPLCNSVLGFELKPRTRRELLGEAPNPLKRKPIREVFSTGIRSIDCLCTLGRGQRIGLFAGAGVGKSTLLGMLAKYAAADITVIALVGERGREVNEFITGTLGVEGLQKSIVVVATADEPPLRRYHAAHSATSIAEHYRRQGKNVLLLVDSLTRVARALREIGLANGEIPVRQGFTPSVYTELPRLLERSGTDDCGSITAFYTVLTNGELEPDPLAEEIKSLLDGHLILEEGVAQRGIRPAINPLSSISRLMSTLCSAPYLEAVGNVRRLLARLNRDKDLLLLGGEPDEELKAALALEGRLNRLLNQAADERASREASMAELNNISELFMKRSLTSCS